MRTFRAQAWAIWLLGGGVLVLATRNPLYLVLLLAISRIVQATCAAGSIGPRLQYGRIAALILLFSTLFN
ncbi:MAG TPA: hypothetical protein PLH39_10875, partial [Promineifilum sp.]|nr:hypothetical protein [Promineifilum sp.]